MDENEQNEIKQTHENSQNSDDLEESVIEALDPEDLPV